MANKTNAKKIKSRIGAQIQDEISPDLDLSRKIIEGLEEDQIINPDEDESLNFIERLQEGREDMRGRFDPAVKRIGERVVSPVRSIVKSIGGGARKLASGAGKVKGFIGETLGLPSNREEFAEAGQVALRRGLQGVQAGLSLPEGAEPGLLSAAVGGLEGLRRDIESEASLASKAKKESREQTELEIKELKILNDFRLVPVDTPGARSITLPTSGKKISVIPKVGALERLGLATSKEARIARNESIKRIKDDIKIASDEVFGKVKMVGGKEVRVGGIKGKGSKEFEEGLRRIRKLELKRAVEDPSFEFNEVREIKRGPRGFFGLTKGKLRLGEAELAELGLTPEEKSGLDQIKLIPEAQRTEEQNEFIDAMMEKVAVATSGK